MSDWLNSVTINVPRNGTTSHTVNPSSTGFVAAGTAFTPTAGRLLVAVVEGAVTSSTPSGWTLPTGGSAVNNTGLYVWYRTAAGGDTIATTHNGSNYPMVVTFFEFAAGSTFLKSAASTTASLAGANPALTGLTGTNWLAAAKAVGLGSGDTYVSAAWSGTPTPTKLVDTSVTFATTDGYGFTVAEANAATATSYTPTASLTSSRSVTCEALTFAVSVASSGGSPTFPVSGSVAGTSTASAAVTARASASGVNAGVSAATAAASSRLVVTGSAAATSTAVSAPTALLPVGGSVSAVSAAAGSLGTGLAPASGTVAATSTTGGAATSRLVVTGHADAVADGIGAVSAVQPVSGVVAGSSAIAGAVTLIPGDAFSVTGTVTATSTTAASVRALLVAAGQASATTATAATVGARSLVAGAVAATLALVGAAQTIRTAAGSVAVVSSVSASVSNPSNDRDITVTATGPYRHPLTVTSVHGSTVTVGAASRNPITVTGATR